jgi:uncharacterized protein (DUF433 family)
MNWRERIESDPQTLHGRLRVRGTRIPVSVVLDNLATHVDLREVLTNHPSLSEEDVRACLAWAAECSHAAEHAQGHEGVIDADFGDSPEPGEAAEERATAAARPKEGNAPRKAAGFKDFLRAMPNVGADSDFERPVDYGRPEVEWGT